MKNLIIAIVLLTAPGMAFANTNIKLKQDQGYTEFLALGNPGFLRIKGTGKAPTGDLTVIEGKLAGTLKMDLTSLDTGMELRNKHMKEKYLQVGTHPEATITIKDQATAWSPSNGTVDGAKVTGTLKLHGEEKPVEITYTIDEQAKIKAQFELKISDFKMGIPSFMGITVADKVNVTVESQMAVPALTAN